MKKELSITYMSGPLDGKKMVFEQPTVGEERIVSIGRREGCDIHLPFDNQASRLHARLGIKALPTTGDPNHRTPILSFWLEDSGSRNGTYIDRDEEPIINRVSLRPGTLFRIGRTWLRLDIPMSYGD